MAFHKDMTGYDIHVIYAWEYADQATRTGANGFVEADIGKLSRQLDNNTFWILTATTPTWEPLSSDSSTVWGFIEGSIGDQTDLQSILNSKASTFHSHLEEDILDLDHVDSNAFHKGTSAEISLLIEKPVLLSTDKILIEDSEDGHLKKYAQIGSFSGTLGIFGRALYSAKDEEESSTSSEDYQLKLRLTTGDLPLGSYLIQWQYEVQGRKIGHSRTRLNSSEELGFNFYSQQNKKVQADVEHITISGFTTKASLSGVNTIDIDWKAHDDRHSFQIRRARLILWRIF